MKAKEYYKRLEQAEDRNTMLTKNARSFVSEFIAVLELRNIKIVYDEFEKKWRNYAFLVNSKLYPVSNPIRYDGFKNLIKAMAPGLFIMLSI